MSSDGTSLLIRLLTAISKTSGIETFDREMQTDLDFEEVLGPYLFAENIPQHHYWNLDTPELKIRQSDKELAHRKQEQHKFAAAAMEDRIQKYQRELESRYKSELEEQVITIFHSQPSYCF